MRKLTPIERLAPGVIEDSRLLFKVQSRTNKNKFYTVDVEQRDGLSRCDCADATLNKNPDCWHVRQVRKYITVKVAQAVITANQK